MRRSSLLWLWKRHRATRGGLGGLALLSTTLHALAVIAAVRATDRSGLAPEPQSPRMVQLLNRVPRERIVPERLVHIELRGPGTNAVAAEGALGGSGTLKLGAAAGAAGGRVSPPDTARAIVDSVLTVYEVETKAQLKMGEPGPQYPPALRENGVEGTVFVRYVVDTTGRADSASVKFIEATHPLFAVSVREALLRMRFAPARVGNLNVRQLVEQSFQFRIAPDSSG